MGEWDWYFLGIAKAVSENTKCRSRKIGAVLVQGKSIVSTGYNGPPSGMRPCDERWCADRFYDELKMTYEPFCYIDSNEPTETQEQYVARTTRWLLVEQPIGKCPRRVLGYPSGKGLEVCVAGHAERNALIHAAKLGIKTEGATLYCWCGIPCKDCMIEIINAGVKEIVCLETDYRYDELAEPIARECGISIRQVKYEDCA